MRVEHDYPQDLTDEQREKLDELVSDSMQLFFDLRDTDKANNVLLKGTEIIND
jgi:hypothetical protein